MNATTQADDQQAIPIPQPGDLRWLELGDDMATVELQQLGQDGDWHSVPTVRAT